MSEGREIKTTMYANAVSWKLGENEGIVDFHIIHPEMAMAEAEKAEEGSIDDNKVKVNLDELPVEMRVFLPRQQFLRMAQLMGEMREQMDKETAEKGKSPQE